MLMYSLKFFNTKFSVLKIQRIELFYLNWLHPICQYKWLPKKINLHFNYTTVMTILYIFLFAYKSNRNYFITISPGNPGGPWEPSSPCWPSFPGAPAEPVLPGNPRSPFSPGKP